VQIVDVLQAALAEVEEYPRVHVYPVPRTAVLGAAANDVIHLLAELVENATVFSPPANEVSVRAAPVGRGLAVEIEDRGLGLPAEEREAINRRLASPPEFDASGTERLGLVVVGRLADRHGIKVELHQSPFGGTTAVVLIPAGLIIEQDAGEDASRDAAGGEPEPVGVLPGSEDTT
jgi:signal transduction histidine kinase